MFKTCIHPLYTLFFKQWEIAELFTAYRGFLLLSRRRDNSLTKCAPSAEKEWAPLLLIYKMACRFHLSGKWSILLLYRTWWMRASVLANMILLCVIYPDWLCISVSQYSTPSPPATYLKRKKKRTTEMEMESKRITFNNTLFIVYQCDATTCRGCRSAYNVCDALRGEKNPIRVLFITILYHYGAQS